MIDRGFVDFQVNPQGQTDLTFRIKQTWDWLVPVVWVVSGPTAKTFQYLVKFSLNDQYGNPYTDNWSDPLIVGVFVSRDKRDYAGVALASVITAQVFFALSFIPGFAQAGSACAAAAAGWGKAALDPPAPDPRFREPIFVVYPNKPAPVIKDPSLTIINNVVYLWNKIAYDVNALSTTEGRLLGAQLAKDQKATALQKERYQTILASLLESAQQLSKAIAEKLPKLVQEDRLNPPSLVPTLLQWQRDGLPAEVKERALHSGLTPEQVDQIDEAIRSPLSQPLLTSASVASLLQASYGIVSAARSIQTRGRAIILAHSAKSAKLSKKSHQGPGSS
jgi:hypothetical protein